MISALPCFKWRVISRDLRLSCKYEPEFGIRGEYILFHDLDTERNNRLWLEFWTVLFGRDANFCVPQSRNALLVDKRPVSGRLHDFLGSVSERIHEDLEIDRLAGREACLTYLGQLMDLDPRLPVPSLLRELIAFIVREYSVDTFWDGPVRQLSPGFDLPWIHRPQESLTKFGSIEIVEHPFAVIWHSDEEDAFAVLCSVPELSESHDQILGDLLRLVALNQQLEIIRRRAVRRHLRSLARKTFEYRTNVGGGGSFLWISH